MTPELLSLSQEHFLPPCLTGSVDSSDEEDVSRCRNPECESARNSNPQARPSPHADADVVVELSWYRLLLGIGDWLAGLAQDLFPIRIGSRPKANTYAEAAKAPK